MHSRSLKLLRGDAVITWEENLKEESDTARLQAEAEEWRRRREKKEIEDKEKVASSSSSRSRKKKRKKKKKKKEEKAARGVEETPGKVKIGGKTSAKKTLEAVFQGTGLDPCAKNRKKLVRKVKKALRKNKESSTSTSSSSGTSSGELEEEILQDRSRVHRMASIAPGLLSAQGVQSMKQYLTQVTGSGWEADSNQLPPLLGLYNRTYMTARLAGGVGREFTTLCWVGDLLLQGRVAEAMVGLMQRLKSLEMTSTGTPWATSQKLELVPPANASIGSRQEMQIAKKEARLDSEFQPSLQGGDKTKGKGKEKGRDKGKEKGRGKGRESEGKKGGKGE